MRTLPPILAVIIGLLLALAQGRAGEAEEAKLKAQALEFAKGYDLDWNKPLKTLIEDVIKAVGGDEATKKALIEGAKPVAEKLKAHWRTVYSDYYLPHRELPFSGSFWDDYAEMLGGELNLKGQHELTAAWEKLLRDTLAPAQLPVWEAEMKRRHERWPKAAEAWLKVRLAKLEKNARDTFESRAATLAAAAGMSKERAEALKPAVEAAVEANMQVNRPYGEKAARLWGEEFIEYRETTLQSLEKGTYVGYRSPVEAGWKAGHKAFDTAVDKVLLPQEREQQRALEAKAKGRIARIAKDMSVRVLQQTQERMKVEQNAHLQRLATAVGMDEARQSAFKKRLEASAQTIEAEWTQSYLVTVGKQIEGRVKGGNGEETLKAMEAGRWWLTDDKADEKALLAREAAWQAATKEFVKPEELARAEAEEKHHNDLRSHLLAVTAVSELDQRLLLMPEQRKAIEKLALEAAKPIAALPMELNEMWQQSLSGSLFLVHAIGLKKIEALLLEPQKKEFTALAENCKYQWGNVESRLHKKS